MDFESLNQYEGKQVKLTLINGFWYKAKIISVGEKCITFIEMKGNTISVDPSQIMICEEVNHIGY